MNELMFNPLNRHDEESTMNKTKKPTEAPHFDRALNNEQPLREGVIPGKSDRGAGCSIPPINERDPLPTKPPTKGK